MKNRIETLAQNHDPRRRARALYWQGWGMAKIAEALDIPEATIRSWKRRDAWDATSPVQRIAATIEERLVALISTPDKTGGDFKEIDLLCRQLERPVLGGSPAVSEDEEPEKTAKRKAKSKNPIHDEQAQQLITTFQEGLFAYQKQWYQAGQQQRIRNILKSRQIGATWYFAQEAFVDALLTGRNQIFLSASRAQVMQFRSYIVAFAKTAEVELRGDPIVLPNGAELIFLSTNSRTAQSYHGNLYVDEYFWIHKFMELRKTAGGMASHKQWRITYFSTPSAITHDAYPFWTGAHYNRGRPKVDHIKLDVSHPALQRGVLAPDGQWRQIVTIEDAEQGGCTLFDVEQLRRENSPLEFNQLYMCQFIDDADSVFPLSLLQSCMVDTWVVWEDFKPHAAHPLGSRPVWIGYDPSHTGDNAGCVVIAPPAVPEGPFRILEKYQWSGMDFDSQAKKIKELTKKYTVTFIGIDRTGIGEGVFQLVKQFFPGVTGYSYSPDVKNRFVIKTYDTMHKGRLQFDSGWTDLAASFMAIRKTLTASGRQTTYVATRNDDISHADIAWATMHALLNEPLEGRSASTTSFMEMF